MISNCGLDELQLDELLAEFSQDKKRGCKQSYFHPDAGSSSESDNEYEEDNYFDPAQSLFGSEASNQ